MPPKGARAGRRATCNDATAPASCCTISSLPDELLGQVLAAAGRAEWQTVTLVCRRWCRVFYSEPALWHTLKISPDSLLTSGEHGARRPFGPTKAEQWFAARHALLQRVGGLVEAAVLQDIEGQLQAAGARTASGWLPEDFLHQLQPGALRQLTLDFNPGPPIAVLRAALRFSRLTSLMLSVRSEPACTPAIIRQLTQLHSLSYSISYGSDLVQSFEAVGQLRQLSRLQLEVVELTAGAMSALHRQLQRLPQLQRLVLHEHYHFNLAGEDDEAALQPPLPATLPSLRAYEVRTHASMQVAGSVLRECNCFCEGQAPPGLPRTPWPWPGAVELEVLGRPGQNQMGQLRALLAALLPAGASLASLHIVGMRLAAGNLRACTQLAQLECLSLYQCAPARSVPAALKCLLQQAPRLQELSLCSGLASAVHSVPACVVKLQGLKRLDLSENKLSKLPPGPYLTGLLELDLSKNAFSELPTALSTATALRLLDLSSNYTLQLCNADVYGTLMHMRQLACLDMRQRGVAEAVPASVLQRLRRRLPDLKVVVNEG